MKKKNPKLIDPCLKKKEEKKRTYHTFSPVSSALSVCRSLASLVVTHSHFPAPSRPIQFLSCGFCVFEEEEQSRFLLIEEEEEKTN